jgi:hypothetical protein
MISCNALNDITDYLEEKKIDIPDSLNNKIFNLGGYGENNFNKKLSVFLSSCIIKVKI